VVDGAERSPLCSAHVPEPGADVDPPVEHLEDEAGRAPPGRDRRRRSRDDPHQVPTVVTLFAEGLLPPVGGAPVEVRVGREPLGAMVLSEVRCTGSCGHRDVAVLVFRRASAAPMP